MSGFLHQYAFKKSWRRLLPAGAIPPGRQNQVDDANRVMVTNISCRQKKADVAEHPKVFDHVGLLFNEPPRQGRVVLHLVIRRTLIVSHGMENATAFDRHPPLLATLYSRENPGRDRSHHQRTQCRNSQLMAHEEAIFPRLSRITGGTSSDDGRCPERRHRERDRLASSRTQARMPHSLLWGGMANGAWGSPHRLFFHCRSPAARRAELRTAHMRHAAVKVEGNTLLVFNSVVGDSPERILASTIDLCSTGQCGRCARQTRTFTRRTQARRTLRDRKRHRCR